MGQHWGHLGTATADGTWKFPLIFIQDPAAVNPLACFAMHTCKRKVSEEIYTRRLTEFSSHCSEAETVLVPTLQRTTGAPRLRHTRILSSLGNTGVSV